MKNIFFNILTVSAIALFAFAACDKIDEPFLYKPDVIIDSTKKFPNLENPVKQNVLLEDFTGQSCTYCYKGAAKAQELLEQYGGQLVAMAVHSGTFATPKKLPPYTYDFRTNEGEEWGSFYNITTNPSGPISRIKNGQTYIIDMPQWANKVENASKRIPKIGLQIMSTLNVADSALSVYAKVHFLPGFEKTDLNFSVMITESNIVKPQKVGTKDSLNYVHNHVMRAVLYGGIWGTKIVDKSSVPAEPLQFRIPTLSFGQLGLNKDLVAKNCHIVAFISNPVTKEILQVTEEKIVLE